MEFWNTALSVVLAAVLGVIGFQARTVLNNTRRLDKIEGAKLPERATQAESDLGELAGRVSTLEAMDARLERIEQSLGSLPERIATLEAHDFRKTTDQLHSKVNSLDRSVARFDGTVARLEQTVTDMNAWLMTQKAAS